VLDDFQRAIDSSRNDEKMELSHFVEGIEMIEKQFIDLMFKKYGVEKYCEKGDEFDPTIHLAMTAEEGDYENETVIEVFRSGYKLHDRVIRAAEVKVGKPKE
jgi:molecular chaperone GrpE